MLEPKDAALGSGVEVRVAPDRELLGARAAAHAVRVISRAVESRGTARIVLASAPSQDELLAGLAGAGLPWDRIQAMHMDEYVGIEPAHPAAFQQYLRTRLPPALRLEGIDSLADDPEAEVVRYAGVVGDSPIDLCLMGIGENGHIAFNEPHDTRLDDPRLVRLTELDEVSRTQQVNDGCFAQLDEVPRSAITLTVGALLSADTVIASVPGPRKATAVARALQGPVEWACPASALRTHANATLYLDPESAAEVSVDG